MIEGNDDFMRRREVKEIPEVGQLWIEKRWMGETLSITHRRFVTSFTGQARELLHLGMGIKDQDSWTLCGHATLLTHHELNGKPVTFMWTEIRHEYLYPEEIEVPIRIPRKMVPVILGRNKEGYALSGKMKKDLMALYEKKAVERDVRKKR